MTILQKMNNHLQELFFDYESRLRPDRKTRLRFKFLRIKAWFKGMNPFDWRILLYRKHPYTVGHPSNMCKVGYNGKWLYLLDPQGNELPGQVSMTLRDRVNKVPEATIEVMVDLTKIINVDEKQWGGVGQ